MSADSWLYLKCLATYVLLLWSEPVEDSLVRLLNADKSVSQLIFRLGYISPRFSSLEELKWQSTISWFYRLKLENSEREVLKLCMQE